MTDEELIEDAIVFVNESSSMDAGEVWPRAETLAKEVRRLRELHEKLDIAYESMFAENDRMERKLRRITQAVKEDAFEPELECEVLRCTQPAQSVLCRKHSGDQTLPGRDTFDVNGKKFYIEWATRTIGPAE